MKSLFKNLSLYLLTLILILSSVISSYAIGGNNNNNNNNSNNVGGGGDFSTSSGKFGLRFSLVYKDDPSTVVSVDDAGNPTVIDMWYCTYAQFKQYTETNSLTNLTQSNMHSAVKTQTLNEQNKIYPIWFPDYITEAEWAQSNDSLSAEQKQKIANSSALLKSIPRWLGYESGHYVTYGLQLQDWENANNYANITSLLQIVDKNDKYIFQTKESIEASTSENKIPVTEKTLSHVNDTVLMIEPLLLFTPCYVGTSTPMMNKQYGTVTNIIEAMWDNPVFKAEYNKNKQMNHLNYKMTDIAWNALNIKVTPYFKFNYNYYLSKFVMYTDAKNHIGTEQSGILNWSVLNETRDWTHFDVDSISANFKNGYALNIFWFSELGLPNTNSNLNIINTYDITTNPVKDASSEPSTGKKDPEIYKEKALTFKIDKHYRYKDSSTGKVTEISYYTTLNAPHTIQITDERDKNGFVLKDWFTSTDNWLPESGKSPSDYNWESVVKGQHKNGKYAGTGEQLLTVQATDPDNVLHLLYEFEGKPFINIVKVYKNDDDSINHTKGPETSENTKTYTVEEDEEGYDYVETLISNQDPTPNNPNGSSDNNKTINIPEGTKTLYIIYKAPIEQLKLYSNELSYTYDLRDLVKTRVLFGIYDSAPKSPGYSPDCVLHPCGRSGKNCPHYRRCSLGRHTLTDQTFGLSVANNYNYNSETTFIKDYNYTSAGNASNSKTWFAQVNSIVIPLINQVKPNGDFLLYRQKDKDLVTLYPEKNDGLLSKLNSLGITSVAYSPSGTRVEKEMEKDKYFTNHFQTYFDYILHDMNLSWKWPRSRCNKNHGGSYSSSVVTTPAMANDYYSGASGTSQNVKEWYFVGQSNQGMNDTLKDTRDASFGNIFKENQGFQYTSAELKFYPYAKMFYRAKNDNSKMQPVYITSENLSTMKVFNAIQVGVYKKNKINANLTSTQWSTHARSLSFLQNHGIDDKKSVLPGGAIQDIDMGNSSDTKISVRIWQTCLPDENVAKVQDGFKVSVSEAKSAANALKSDIINILQGYGLVQWCMEGVATEKDEILKSGEELHENTDISFVLGNNGKTASDEKYYLRHDGSGSNRANFDVLGSRIDKQVLYTIKSDTDGNVWVEKDGTELGRIGMTQSASDLCKKHDEIALLDDNTRLVTNYISAIDRNKGESNKYDRYNRNKYNEAFDGISVLVTDITFDLGFSANNAHRTNVLDPLLTAKANSKSDLYNFSADENVRSSVYVTTTTSTSTANKENGYIGTLKGISGIGDLKVYIGDIQSLVYTKNFYIPNATVSDLN